MIISNLISMSVILFYILPLIFFGTTGNYIHLSGFLGVVGTTIISESVKLFCIGTISPRPEGARDCNLLCNDGNQAGKPGMPSSHSASAGFFLGFYFQQTDSIFIRGILIIYTSLVMLSRYVKRCHTINQILVGAFLGMGLSWLLMREL
jgi:membrane-associated phospholipid phosphatase